MLELEHYIEGLKVPQGRYIGESFKLFSWERRFIRGAFADGVEEAALSLGRGGGKTTFLAAILAAAVDVEGPLVQPNSEAALVASSFEQARIAYRHLLRMLEPSFEAHGVGRRGRFRVQDSPNQCSVTDRETGASVTVKGSDPRRLHGLAPSILLLDEMAQWPPSMIGPMLAALETSLGKIPNARMLAIGTRPASSDHPFAQLLRGTTGYSQVHAARDSDPPFQKRTWIKANPSLPDMPDLEKRIRSEAALAKVDPDRLASFKALRLNLGTADTSETFVIDPAIWERIEGAADAVGAPVFAVDLGTSAAQSCVSAYWQETGRLDTIAAFPAIPNLRDRGIADGVGGLYEQCAARGELVQLGERVSDVRALLTEALERFGLPLAVVCDRWRIAELTQELEALGVYVPVVERGMGFKDGAEDIRSFREACLKERVTPTKSLLMRAAIREGRCVSDPAGNEKLAKGGQGGRRNKARDDALASAILAVAAGYRDIQAALSAPKWEYAIAG